MQLMSEASHPSAPLQLTYAVANATTTEELLNPTNLSLMRSAIVWFNSRKLLRERNLTDIFVATIMFAYIAFVRRFLVHPRFTLLSLIPLLPISVIAFRQMTSGTTWSMRTLARLTLAIGIYYVALLLGLAIADSDGANIALLLCGPGATFYQAAAFFRLHRQFVDAPIKPSGATLSLLETLSKQMLEFDKQPMPTHLKFTTYSVIGAAGIWIAELMPDVVILTRIDRSQLLLISPEEFQIEPHNHYHYFGIKPDQTKVRIQMPPHRLHGIIKNHFLENYNNWKSKLHPTPFAPNNPPPPTANSHPSATMSQ
jgi:hypothetical protein